MDQRRSWRGLRTEIAPRTLLIIAAVVGGLWVFERVWPILIMLVVALVVVGTLNPMVSWLERRGLKRHPAVAVVFLSLAVAVGLLGLLTVPALVHQLAHLVEQAPQLQQHLAEQLTRVHLLAPLAPSVRAVKLGELVKTDFAHALSYSSQILIPIAGLATTLVLSIYLLADREGSRGALYALVPRRYHVRLAHILLNLETIVGGYMRGQVITSLLIMAFTFVLLSVCRVPNALALAAFAGLTDVLPFVGGLLATTPAVLAALSRGPGTALVVLGAMVAYQELESRVIVPRVYGRTLRLSSAAVIVALLVGGELLGFVGALLALPAAAGLRMIVEELRVNLPGDDTDDSALRRRDQDAEADYAARTSGAPVEEAAAVATAIARQVRDDEEEEDDDQHHRGRGDTH